MQTVFRQPVIALATYNEAKTIGRILDELDRYLVVVVDDSSPDGTGSIVRTRTNAQLVTRYHKQGIASAYVTALRQALLADPLYVVQMDAGMTHDPKDVRRMCSMQANTRADLVIGSRFCNGVQVFTHRTAVSMGAALLMRLIGVNVRDATSGFRLWRSDLLERVLAVGPIKAHGFAFQLELLYRASKLGARIVEFPIEYKLGNSSFNQKMVVEAFKIYGGLTIDYLF